MVTMLKNKCSVWKRIKFSKFWYNCYYFTWSDTYFIQLETLLINHPSYLFSHSVLVPISLSRANLTLLFGSVFKSVVNCGPHSRSGRTTQEIMESQERSACRYHSYYCVQYLLHHSHSPSVMRGYRLHKPVSAIPSHSLPRHHRLTRGLTLSLILYVVYFSRRINRSGQKSTTKNCSLILNPYVGSSGF